MYPFAISQHRCGRVEGPAATDSEAALMSDPRHAVDDFTPAYVSLGEQILARPDDDATFLVARNHTHGRRTWTTTAWKAFIMATARRVGAAGIRDGDTVAVLCRSDADTLATIFACWVLGATVAPLDARDGYPSLHRSLRAIGPRAILAAGEAEHELVHLTPAPWPLLAMSAIASPTTHADPSRRSDAEQPLLVLQSSGTSGVSKGVVLSERNLLVNCDAMLRSFAWAPADNVLTVLPISHGNGLIIGALLPWLAGARMVLCDRFDATAFWAISRDEGATTASVVPTVMAALLDAPGTPSPQFRDVVSGSGPLPVDLASTFEERFVPVRQLYGLSETTAVLTITPRHGALRRDVDVSPCTTAGPAVAHADVAVVDDHGYPCPQGVRGEIVARGAMIMQRYLGAPEPTSEALRDGWFHTGDQGAWRPGPDGRPWFTVTGRLKDIIVRGGLSISPLEIDVVLNAHPAVREALCFGYPDARYGEEIAAFVVAEKPVSEHELLELCTRELGRARRPRRIIFGSEIPRTHTGKPRRAALAQRFASSRDEN